MQTKAGIIKMQQTIKDRYGLTPDGKSVLHVKVGSMGGKKTAASGKLYEVGFASNRQRAVEAGRIGGRISRRTSNK